MDFGPIFQPLHGRLGLPDSLTVAPTKKPSHGQNHASFWGTTELIFVFRFEKTVKNPIFGPFLTHF